MVYVCVKILRLVKNVMPNVKNGGYVYGAITTARMVISLNLKRIKRNETDPKFKRSI